MMLKPNFYMFFGINLLTTLGGIALLQKEKI